MERVKRSGRVGGDERPGSEKSGNPHPQADLGRGVALVKVESALPDEDLRAGKTSGDQTPGVPGHGRAWETGDVPVGQDMGVFYGAGRLPETGAEDDGDLGAKPLGQLFFDLPCGLRDRYDVLHVLRLSE